MSNVVAEAGLNRIPVGYKQTEVGVIPEDWDLVSLQNMAIPNGLVRGPFGGAIKKEHFIKTGYKVYEQRNAIYETVEIGNYYIDQKKFDELKRFSISHNDFIVSCSGTIGRIYQIPKKYPKGVINQALLKITLNHNIDSKYFYHYFKWDVFQERIIDGTQGGAMKNLVGMAEFKRSLIPLPSAKEEQTAIANALSDVDALITELEKLITKKQAIKTATMQQLLTGRTRLPQFALREDGSKKGTKQSELGEIPEDWDVINIEELGHVDPENLSSTTSSDYEFNYISLEQIEKGVLLGTIKTIFKNAPSRARRVIKKGDILVSTVRPNLMSHYFIRHDANDLICSTGFSVIRFFKEKLCPGYLYQHLFSSVINNQIEMLISGSNYPAINSGDVKKLKIQVGNNVEEQTAIATVLSDMDEEIQALEQRLSKTRQIKQGMMQELLTGRTRLV